ncbi:DUF192 domain-containing protein [Patescibacteria group bacterium]|nr:DUF192 domain-containing protein [Patescibacteria group bacterium]MDE1946727.1 DUF192 domain-containing protein [Patescibacteria group bacterium]MDE2010970.1 DUF192 domain-containing protein [Patescibacteria group bacterium]MDE2232813.1 DUF192 domain-containing protein [Patescibacteria group bacterium]
MEGPNEQSNNSGLMKSIAIITGIIAVFALAGYLVSSGEFPSLDEFIASSTDLTASPAPVVQAGHAREDKTVSVRPASADTLPDYSYSTTTVGAPRGSIQALVSNNPAKRELGLSYRTSLPADAGMLFIFPSPGNYGFWMKDMNFPLDIVWVRSDRVVVGVERSVLPDTYPETFYPPSQIQFVLELNAGESDRFGIAAGTVLKF